MTAIEILKHEHRIILHVLAAAEGLAQDMQTTGQVDKARLAKLADFFRTFVEACHNAKEEEYVFPRMRELGGPEERSLIEDLLGDHEMGRRLVAAMAGTADPPRLAADLTAYCQLLKDHIDREDHVLFPRVDRLFGPKDQTRLQESFARHEAEEMGAGVHEKYEKLAHELAQKA